MSYHITVTDDDIAIRKILQIILKKEGFSVSICDSGNSLLDHLKDKSSVIDCIILDIKMPGISGLELLGILKTKYPLIPVIMLTAFTDLDTGMKAIRKGAEDYLSKPVRRSELVSRIDDVIKKSKKKYAEKEKQQNKSKQQQFLEDQLNEAHNTIMRTTMATIKAFSETIEQKDPYTKGHCTRVFETALLLGKKINLTESDLTILEGGCLLHDIGKIGIPENILNKPGKLTHSEYSIIKSHPEAGEKILKYIDMFTPYTSIVRNHHERFDGAGYPDGLSGSRIPLLVRIVTLADAFDAMTSDRSYRKSLTLDNALLEIVHNKGKQFDPELVNVFINSKFYEKK
ncbi:MAG: response regulator [Spirochaetales bacterium]|nr:response regulator [Spirochaetales bacterium]